MSRLAIYAIGALVLLAVLSAVREGMWQRKQSAWDAEAAVLVQKAREDSAAAARRAAIADSATERSREADARSAASEALADSLHASTQSLRRSIAARPVPPEAVEFTAERDELIARQDQQLAAMETALEAQKVATAEQRTAAEEYRAAYLIEQASTARLTALLDDRPRPRRAWLPDLTFGYGVVLSRRELMENGTVSIHDGPNVSLSWKVALF